jgi:glutathione peroxidase
MLPFSCEGFMTLFDIEATTIDGQPRKLADYAGKVMLVVNVASRCGFTPQYAGLEALYRKFADRGFVVLGFPCNQFGAQEPGSERRSRPSVRRSTTSPFHCSARSTSMARPRIRSIACLSARRGNSGFEAIKWNFTKFLVDREGHVVKRYAPTDTPEQIAKDVEALL